MTEKPKGPPNVRFNPMKVDRDMPGEKLLQDESSGLSKALSQDPNALELARESAHLIGLKESHAELLYAAKSMLGYNDCLLKPEFNNRVSQAIAAIKKAELL